MFFGPTPVGEAIARLEEARAEFGDDLLLEAAIGRPLGGFLALQGRVEEGWVSIERTRSILIELGLRQALAHLAFVSGRVAKLAGDLEAAEQEFADASRVYGEIGEYGRRSTLVGELADVLYELDRLDEAERFAEEAAALGGADDISTQSLSLRVRGRVLARRGRIAEAERLVREAVDLLATTDFLDFRAETICSLAEVLALAEQPRKAEELLGQALELTRRRGNVLLERQVSARLAGLR